MFKSALITSIASLTTFFAVVQSQKMRNPVVYFEIPVKNMKRATTFYEKVFGFEFEITNIDGNEMALFPLDEKLPGVTGALAKGESYKPSLNGSRLYFFSKDLVQTMKKVKANGGKELYPVTNIGEYGFVAEFQDSEGNRIALSSPPRA